MRPKLSLNKKTVQMCWIVSKNSFAMTVRKWRSSHPSFPISACPANTYDGGNGTCVSCPPDSHTTTNASTSLQQCVCDEGFMGVPGGECLRELHSRVVSALKWLYEERYNSNASVWSDFFFCIERSISLADQCCGSIPVAYQHYNSHWTSFDDWLHAPLIKWVAMT